MLFFWNVQQWEESTMIRQQPNQEKMDPEEEKKLATKAVYFNVAAFCTVVAIIRACKLPSVGSCGEVNVHFFKRIKGAAVFESASLKVTDLSTSLSVTKVSNCCCPHVLAFSSESSISVVATSLVAMFRSLFRIPVDSSTKTLNCKRMFNMCSSSLLSR